MMYTLKALAFELYLQPNTKNHIAIAAHSRNLTNILCTSLEYPALVAQEKHTKCL